MCEWKYTRTNWPLIEPQRGQGITESLTAKSSSWCEEVESEGRLSASLFKSFEIKRGSPIHFFQLVLEDNEAVWLNGTELLRHRTSLGSFFSVSSQLSAILSGSLLFFVAALGVLLTMWGSCNYHQFYFSSFSPAQFAWIRTMMMQRSFNPLAITPISLGLSFWFIFPHLPIYYPPTRLQLVWPCWSTCSSYFVSFARQ